MSKAENPNQEKLLLLSDTPDFEADFAENEIHFPNLTEIELLDKKRKINLQKLFTPEGMDLIIAEIQKEVVDFSADISTKEGRAKIVSMAAKVAKCKSPIKNLASELKEESRRLIDGVNAQWNRYESAMDELRDQIRKPVDEIEEKEAAALKGRQDRLAAMENLRGATNGVILESGEFQKLIQEVKNYLDFDWGDFAFRAETLANELIAFFEAREAFAKKAEADAAELAQLKKEAAERAQKDHEEKIAREAAEKAKREAEEAAERERKAAIEREAKIEADKKAAEERAKEAERLAIEQAEKAELARIAAEKKAKEDAEKAALEAVEKERLRVDAEFKKALEVEAQKKAAEEKLAANKKHRAKINNEILTALKIITAKGIEANDHELEKAIIEAIVKGEVPHVQINY
ncbi:MAG: hypothetical protein KA100_06855 [Rickettsiales bacterium]|nr:hypothetical protein [Rickettsiales bacterium]